ncbi:MAG: RNA polymerase factor sigma-54 [Smithellaceae bacterium]|jgi:RNA polymerase sigma-54 factor|nr:RNA polymerase factor sigma-54 [Syntrophaceae bacterium]OPZ54524.1 MAG: RNA polymerase sigma-54 factor [Deltaproteobacteria bacterium ADurb.BinA014]HNV63785.1 RNA polymerase factor sigma-54 [Smithellaceae bacterium]MBP8608905.1 RNA polymerase factor sigma-54 [Syntrophaceae bacterium]HOZ60658.1 RNA polymerase factor sigma-54 [Smithellaceae bacterium]
MAFELKQNLKLSQQLIMTPQLQQAIKLLQLSRLELVETINQEMEENPLLEEVSAEEEGGDFNAELEEDTQSTENADVRQREKAAELTGEGDGREEFDWNNYLEDYGPVGVTYGQKDTEAPTWDNVLTESKSLPQYLMWQMKLSPLSKNEIKVGIQIIGNLDQNGYLCATVAEIASLENVSEEYAESVLQKIQELDPPGIAARNLQECLLIQARMMGAKRNPIVEAIIRDHLKDLELKNYLNIARKLKVPIREVEKAVLLISNMDPRPGSVYAEEKIQTIIPDVYVVKAGDEYKIIVNDDGLPRLRISNFYREIMAGLTDQNNREQENGKKYIREKVQAATWLIKSIQQRQKTIYKVAESIVKFQKDFFDKGINYLKPLVLRDIAADVEMHESTISRVVNNKYMHTPRGIFELKYFFGSSIQRVSGETIASKSVKEEIKKIISQEQPKKPYSDCEIVEMLKGKGITIARRTVAKYREMMGILPSSKRKKYF